MVDILQNPVHFRMGTDKYIHLPCLTEIGSGETGRTSGHLSADNEYNEFLVRLGTSLQCNYRELIPRLHVALCSLRAFTDSLTQL